MPSNLAPHVCETCGAALVACEMVYHQRRYCVECWQAANGSLDRPTADPRAPGPRCPQCGARDARSVVAAGWWRCANCDHAFPWRRPDLSPGLTPSAPPRLPCGCPLDSGCTGHHGG